MWGFRPIGSYYELLIDGDSICLCSRQDTVIQTVLEDLCNRHNKAVKGGYRQGYNDGLADIIACCEDKLIE